MLVSESVVGLELVLSMMLLVVELLGTVVMESGADITWVVLVGIELLGELKVKFELNDVGVNVVLLGRLADKSELDVVVVIKLEISVVSELVWLELSVAIEVL